MSNMYNSQRQTNFAEPTYVLTYDDRRLTSFYWRTSYTYDTWR